MATNSEILSKEDAGTKHEQYLKYYPLWQKVRDCYEGSEQIKSKKDLYLPIPTRNNGDVEAGLRYISYIKRASFYEIVGPTVDVMQGSIFRRDPTIVLDTDVEYIEEDATGTDSSLRQFAQDVVTEIALTGRYGILVDQLPVVEGLNKAEENALGIKPRLTGYAAEAIINWREEVISGVRIPTLIILEEDKIVPDTENRFVNKCIKVHRVLEIDKDGIYRQCLWEDDKVAAFDNGDFVVTPTKAGGSTFDYIPFVFLGINSNTSKIDKPPLLPLAELNVAHYRNSADLEQACFLVGNPTLAVTGLDQTWVDKNMRSGVSLGSDTALALPVGSDAKMLQCSPNNLVASEMIRKEDRMLKLGVRATDGTSGRETATAAKIRTSADEAIMSKISKACSNGITKALYYLYDYNVGTPAAKDALSFQLTMKFYPTGVDSQLILSLISAYKEGTINIDELRDNLFELGIMIDSEADVEDLKKQFENSVVKATAIKNSITNNVATSAKNTAV